MKIWNTQFLYLFTRNVPKIWVSDSFVFVRYSPECAQYFVRVVKLAAWHEEDGALRDEKEQHHEGQVHACADQIQLAPSDESTQHLQS